MTAHDKTRGARILTVIEDFQAEHGYPPSVREIMPRVGLASTAAVQHQILKLERAGALERDPLISRSLRVVRPAISAGVCARPGCGKATRKPRRGPESRWCSRTCGAVAAHVRRWLRATGTEYLAEQIGLPA